jgi:hypothetical protein
MVTAGALLLLVLLTVPGTAPAAKPVPAWPSAQDLQTGQPGVLARDAVCMARYYRGRLSRAAWFTQYWNLTAAQKIVTDAGPEHCMTPAQRLAMTERIYTAIAGEFPQVHCVAVRAQAQTRAQRLAITSRAKWRRVYDGIFRACRLTGALYGAAASRLHLRLTATERSCANRVGSPGPLLYDSPAPRQAQLTSIGAVYDRCTSAQSEQAMYRYLYRQYRFPSKIPCIVRRVAAAVTFVDLLNKAPAVTTSARKAMAACLAGG